MLYYTTVYYTILYYTILYYTILYYTILYDTILYYTILYYILLYTLLYYTIFCYILYYTILYCTIPNYTILYYILYHMNGRLSLRIACGCCSRVLSMGHLHLKQLPHAGVNQRSKGKSHKSSISWRGPDEVFTEESWRSFLECSFFWKLPNFNIHMEQMTSKGA